MSLMMVLTVISTCYIYGHPLGDPTMDSRKDHELPNNKPSALIELDKGVREVITNLITNDRSSSVLLGPDMSILVANDAFFDCYQRFWGHIPKLGDRLNNSPNNDTNTTIDKLVEQVETCIRTDQMLRYEDRIAFRDRALELNASLTPIYGMVHLSFMLIPIDVEEQTQELYSSILSNISESVICIDLHGAITYWNQGATTTFGHTAEEMIGKNIKSFRPDFDTEHISSILNEHQRPHQTQAQWNYKRKDGVHITVGTSTDILFDPRNKMVGIVLIATDITQNKKLERLIKYTHKAAKIGGWEIDVETQTPLWTEETYNIHDVEVGQHVDLAKAFEFYHVDDRPKLQAAFNELMEHSTPYDLEIRFISAKNIHKWVRAIGNVEYDAQGRQLVIGSLQDITNRKEAEEKEKASNILFKNTFENAGMGMALINISGALINANPYLVDLLGYPKKALLNMSFAEFTHPDDIEKDLNLFEQTLSGEIDDYEIEKRYITASGETIWVQLNVSMYRNEKQEPLMAIKMIKNITEKIKAENDLKELNMKLEERVKERTKELTESNEELETFSYMMSHDLRTPLRSALLFSNILDRKHLAELDPKGKEVFAHMQSSLTEMDHLVNDLLEYARMRSNTLKKQQIDTNKLIDEVMKDVGKHYNTTDNCKIDVDEELPKLSGDLTLLYHVLQNIISNSFKYRKPDQELLLSINAEKTDDTVTLIIKDNGTGFSQKYAQDIFKPFERLVNQSEIQGSGIGLAIAERVIYRHNGKIWAEGKEGVGATFYLQLPA